jgi:hypothetical protein
MRKEEILEKFNFHFIFIYSPFLFGNSGSSVFDSGKPVVKDRDFPFALSH